MHWNGKEYTIRVYSYLSQLNVIKLDKRFKWNKY